MYVYFYLISLTLVDKADKNANTKEERSNDVINKENMAAKRNRRNKTTTRQQGNKGEQQSDEQQRESNHGSNARNRTTSKSTYKFLCVCGSN